MYKTIVICISFSFLSSQKATIDVYTIDTGFYQDRFEKDLLKKIFDIYNKNNPDKNIIANVVFVKSFSSLFKHMKDTTRRHYKLAIKGISVTGERKRSYDFSDIYMPSKFNIIKRSEANFTRDGWLTDSLNVYCPQKISLNAFRKLFFSGSHSYIYINENSFEKRLDLIKDYRTDILLLEGVQQKLPDNFTIIDELYDDNSGYGIMYPKGSELRNKLNHVLRYIISSSAYYRLLDKVFGKTESRKLFNYNRNKRFRYK